MGIGLAHLPVRFSVPIMPLVPVKSAVGLFGAMFGKLAITPTANYAGTERLMCAPS
jgi:hypothetical protein